MSHSSLQQPAPAPVPAPALVQAVEVLHITDCGDGGVPAVIDLLLNRPGSHALFLGPLRAKLHNADRCSSLDGYVRSFHPLKLAGVLLRLRRRILALNPRVIHLHSSYAGLLGALVSFTLRRPVLYTPHASAMMIPDPGRAVRVVRQFERLTVMASSCVIACSNDEAAIFESSGRQVTVVPNAVPDAEMNELVPSRGGAGAYDVIGIGRDSAQKDLGQFSQIAALLAQRIPGIRIGWVGATHRAGLDARVDWLGYVPEQEVNRVLASSRVFLATSHYEGFSVASIKAALAGCDIVLRNKPGTRALAADGIGCTLYDEPEQAADAIAGLLAHQADAAAGAARVALARERYSQERQLRLMNRIYERFL